jgi:hypothetical protein
MQTNGKSLYRRWIAVNALGEVFGLGATLGIGAWIITSMGAQSTVTGILLAFAVAVLSGVVEATVVGFSQWWAMRPWFPGITRRAWWLGTLVGALVAYVLGYLPSTLMDLGAQASGQAPVAEPPQAVVLLLAAGLGAVGGAVLSFAQWIVLRRSARGAGVWIPANMLAWAAGMPVIFWGIDAAQKLPALIQSILLMALALLIAGAVVGAIHGAFLVRIAEKNRTV